MFERQKPVQHIWIDSDDKRAILPLSWMWNVSIGFQFTEVQIFCVLYSDIFVTDKQLLTVLWWNMKPSSTYKDTLRHYIGVSMVTVYSLHFVGVQ